MATCATVTVLGASTPTTCTSSCTPGSANVCLNNNTYMCMSGCLVTTGVFCGSQPGGSSGTGVITASSTVTSSTSVLAPVCTEGSEVCSGYTLYTCENNTWTFIEDNSPTCGYGNVGVTTSTPTTTTGTTTSNTVTIAGITMDQTTFTYLIAGAALVGLFVILGGRRD
jgi:hypothetical protein